MTAVGERVTTWSCDTCDTAGSDPVAPEDPRCWWCGQPAQVIFRDTLRPPYAPGIYSPQILAPTLPAHLSYLSPRPCSLHGLAS